MTRLALAAALASLACLGCHKAPPAPLGAGVARREHRFQQLQATPVKLHVTSSVAGNDGPLLLDATRRIVGDSLTRAGVRLADESPVALEISIDRRDVNVAGSAKCVALTARVVREGQAFLAVEQREERCVSRGPGSPSAFLGRSPNLLDATVALLATALSDPELAGAYDGALSEMLNKLDR